MNDSRTTVADVCMVQRDGAAPPSWTASAILDDQGQLKSGIDAFNLMTAAGTMFAGGIHTVRVPSLSALFCIHSVLTVIYNPGDRPLRPSGHSSS